jgi:hypothetical protein
MRETVAAFLRRTGQPYRPPRWLLGRARALGRAEACPTLFRYPGPCGLRDHFEGRLETLGPPQGRELWMAAMPLHDDVGGARLFGTLGVLEPLRFDACRTSRRGIYLGVNRPIGDPALVLWIPPGRLGRRLALDAVGAGRPAPAALRDAGDRERPRVRDRLAAYIEEMAELERAGAAPPGRPWCDVPPGQRRRLLADYGLAPRWTR